MKSDSLNCMYSSFSVKKFDNFSPGMQKVLVHSGANVKHKICKTREAACGVVTAMLLIFPSLAIKALLEKGFKSPHVSDIWLGQSSRNTCVSARGHSFHATWHHSPLTLSHSGLQEQVQLSPHTQKKPSWIKSNH